MSDGTKPDAEGVSAEVARQMAIDTVRDSHRFLLLAFGEDGIQEVRCGWEMNDELLDAVGEWIELKAGAPIAWFIKEEEGS